MDKKIIDNQIIFGMSDKGDGQMIVCDDGVAQVNRRKFFDQVGIDSGRMVAASLVHGDQIAVVGDGDVGKLIPNTDGLITNKKNVCLTITGSDCMPVFFYDKINNVIGLVHAGWRGIVADIVPKMVKLMKTEFSPKKESINVYLGPSIKKCHFEIKEDVLRYFKKYPEAIIRQEEKIFVDLELIVKKQLVEVGVLGENIKIDSVCTYCNKNYFSYRRDKPKQVTSQMAYICLN